MSLQLSIIVKIILLIKNNNNVTSTLFFLFVLFLFLYLFGSYPSHFFVPWSKTVSFRRNTIVQHKLSLDRGWGVHVPFEYLFHQVILRVLLYSYRLED